MTRDDDGRLMVGGVDVVTLAAEHGTAAYVIDEDDFRPGTPSRDSFAAAFDDLAGAHVYYAGKAFLCTEVARWVHEEGLSLDVCTGGELAVARRALFPAIGSASTATTRRSPRSASASPPRRADRRRLVPRARPARRVAPSGLGVARRHGARHRRRRGAHARVHRDRARGLRSSASASPAARPPAVRPHAVSPP